MLETDRPKYEMFYKNFGKQIRYGALASYGQNLESIRDLLLFEVEEGRTSTLKEYVGNMPEAQKLIYYAQGDTVSKIVKLPQAELVRSKGYETGDLGLETEEEKAGIQKKEEEAKTVLDYAKEVLGDRVEAVRLSHRLLSSPVCLATEGEVTLEMERYFRRMPQMPGMEPPKARRIMELNADHPAFKALESAVKTDVEKAKKLIEVLHAQALLISGESLTTPPPTRKRSVHCSDIFTNRRTRWRNVSGSTSIYRFVRQSAATVIFIPWPDATV